MQIRFLPFLSFLFLLQYVHAQAPAHACLAFQLKDWPYPAVTLGYYQGGKAFRADSILVDQTTGRFTFNTERLQPGLYFLSANGIRLLDFMLTTGLDSFSIHGSFNRLDSLLEEHSPENSAYFAFEAKRKKLEESIKAKKQMHDMVNRATKSDPGVLEPLEKEINQLYQSGDSMTIAFTEQYPSLLYTRMLWSVRPPAPPQQLRPQLNGKPNPAYICWTRTHYFDNTDFSDERLLNNNFWHSFFDGFFVRHVAADPDSLIQGIDEVLGKMPKNGAFYRFAVLRLTQYFEQKEAPGADRIFVHMVDKYQRKGETPWLGNATLERLAYKADAHRPNLTGSLALNFQLPDENGNQHALYEVEAPVTMLIFYSSLCEHCKELMPKIYQVYLDYTVKGLKAVAVSTDDEMAYWKKYVDQQGWQWLDLANPKGGSALEKQYAAVNLPVIYLLDRNKRIVFKRVKAEDLGDTLDKMSWK